MKDQNRKFSDLNSSFNGAVSVIGSIHNAPLLNVSLEKASSNETASKNSKNRSKLSSPDHHVPRPTLVESEEQSIQVSLLKSPKKSQFTDLRPMATPKFKSKVGTLAHGRRAHSPKIVIDKSLTTS